MSPEFSSPPGSGSANWGGIGGTLSNQTDLQTALDAKLNATAVSAFGLTLVDDADAAAARTTLGLGTIATQAASNVGITGGSITGLSTLRVPDYTPIPGPPVLISEGGLAYNTADSEVFYSDGALNIPIASTSTAQTLTNKTISGASNTITNVSLSTGVTGTLPVANGGTGQTSAANAINALLPSQTGNSGKYLTTNGSAGSWSALPVEIGLACSDETSNLTADTSVVVFRMPYAMTLTAVRASVTTAPTGSNIIVDINENGSSVLSTKLSIDAGENTSTTAATPPVISDSTLADDAEITIDIDQIGSTIAGTGLKVWLIGTRA